MDMDADTVATPMEGMEATEATPMEATMAVTPMEATMVAMVATTAEATILMCMVTAGVGFCKWVSGEAAYSH